MLVSAHAQLSGQHGYRFNPRFQLTNGCEFERLGVALTNPLLGEQYFLLEISFKSDLVQIISQHDHKTILVASWRPFVPYRGLQMIVLAVTSSFDAGRPLFVVGVLYC